MDPASTDPAPTSLVRTFGARRFDFAREVAVAAIINRTPDSFYDRGATYGLGEALAAAGRALAEGADWLDVGGVKAAPGPEVTLAEELDRVLPLIEALRARTDAVISIDTFRAEVARRALAVGADVVNDPFGLSDPRMAAVAAETGAGLVVMHSGGPPRIHVPRPVYADVVAEVTGFLKQRTGLARQAGVAADRLIVDPGFDFGKTTAHSLELVRRLRELTALGYPVLAAPSNKDFIGETLDLPVDQRLEGTLAAVVACVLNGASIVRVHDVAASVRAVRLTESVLGWRPPAVQRRGLG
jgi:dihydropteroate synthase